MISIGGLNLEHPVLNGSGTFDAIAAQRAFGDALLERFPFSAFVSKTITPEPRAGNPPPRLYETPSGMINSIGLPNKGLEGFLAQDLPQLAELPVPLVVSVMATDRDGFSRLVAGVGGRDEVAAIELNVSCPNVKSGLIVGEQPAETLALCEALRPLTEKPLIVKLTPNTGDPAAVALAAEEGGADAVSLINTLRATGLDPGTREPWLGAGSGGLSGPAVRPVALDQVRRVAAEVERAGDRDGRHRDRRRRTRFPLAGRERGGRRHRELPRSGSRRTGPPGARSAAGPGTCPPPQLEVESNFPELPVPPLRPA